MRRRLTGALAAARSKSRFFLALLSLASMAVLPPAEATDLPEVLKRGTIRALVVVSEEEAYFVSSKPGAPPGFDAEVLEGFARLHKLRLDIVPVGGWHALIPSLLKGKGDLIAGGFTDTESRRRQIEFTAEVFPTRSVTMTRKPRTAPSRVEELRAEKVGTVKGTFMLEDIAAAGVTGVDDGIATGGPPRGAQGGPHHGGGRRSGGGPGRAVARQGPAARPVPGQAQLARLRRAQGGPGPAGGAQRVHRQPAPDPHLEPARRQVFRRGRPRDPEEGPGAVAQA